MTVDMRKVPSYLKGLAETRARAAGDVSRLKALHDEVGGRLAKAQAELESCDVLIRKFDERLNPTLIGAVRPRKTRFGKPGALRDAIIAYLKERAPAEVSTSELSLAIQMQFEFDFLLREERVRWQTNSLTRQVELLMEDGLVERCHDGVFGAYDVGRWRWTGGSKTLDEWQAAAAEAQAAS